MDWKLIIGDLLAAGLRQNAIGRAVGLSPPSIIDLMSGRQKTVRWEVGDRLLALHRDHCPENEGARQHAAG